MDFIESKRQAARDIALSLGVPPMLLGIPGDNTHANYAEAHRSFWRHTVLPLVGRSAKALSGWLGPAYGGGLELRPDLDAIEALSSERDDLWKPIGGATFLTNAEKRAPVGYADEAEDAGAGEGKFNPAQPRVPAGQSMGGRWASDVPGAGETAPNSAKPTRVAELVPSPGDPNRVISDVPPIGSARLAQDVPPFGEPAPPPPPPPPQSPRDRAQTSRDSGQVLTDLQSTRIGIAETAESYVGSTVWSYDSIYPSSVLSGYRPGTNKCSLFVAQILDLNKAGVGRPNHGNHFNLPPNAGQWADPNYDIPGWEVLGPNDMPEPGDIVAQRANYVDGFGHVMFVGFDNKFVGTVDGPTVDPQGVVAEITRKNNIVSPAAKTGPLVFRRYLGR